jgi:hypothetical protein
MEDSTQSSQTIDIENLYQHIHKLEGPRYPLLNTDHLKNTADYIQNYFQQLGLKSEKSEVRIDHLNEIFYNIEGYFSDFLGK